MCRLVLVKVSISVRDYEPETKNQEPAGVHNCFLMTNCIPIILLGISYIWSTAYLGITIVQFHLKYFREHAICKYKKDQF